MRTVQIFTLALLIVGGLNWLTIGLAGVNFVETLFGSSPEAVRVIYIFVGICALYQMLPLVRLFNAPDFRADAVKE